MKKKEIKQEPALLTVEDFPLQMDCQVSLKEYQNYAISSSEEERKKVKNKTLMTSALFLLSGAFIIYRGVSSTWVYKDWLTILGVLCVGYALLDVFYQFILFSTVLKRHIAKEFKKDERLSREMTFCFAEDRMVSFYKGSHQGTFFYDEVAEKEDCGEILLLKLKNGKVMVFPKRVIAAADPQIQTIINGLGK